MGQVVPVPGCNYFLVLVCDKALPATDFDVLEYLLLFKILDALEATDLDVCFLFMVSPPCLYKIFV